MKWKQLIFVAIANAGAAAAADGNVGGAELFT